MIAVVVPTVRPEQLERFMAAWLPLFTRYQVEQIYVHDGDEPTISRVNNDGCQPFLKAPNNPLVFNKNDGVRNAGFIFVAQHLPHIKYIITLDDDVFPIDDPIKDHVLALTKKVPTSWFSHSSEYMRGFPYGVRDESEVVLSHGIWEGVKDWDAPTQLVKGNVTRDVSFYQGPIPKGAMYPMCGMNIAFKRKMLPYMYFAPMGYRVGLDRFADIWLGIESKKIIDKNNWAVVTGYSRVYHSRASNVWKNLQKEARGLEMNENYGRGAYFEMYKEAREAYAMYIQGLLNRQSTQR